MPTLEWFEVKDTLYGLPGWSLRVGVTSRYLEAGEPPEVRIYEVEINTGQRDLKLQLNEVPGVIELEYAVAEMILDRDTEHSRYLAEAS